MFVRFLYIKTNNFWCKLYLYLLRINCRSSQLRRCDCYVLVVLLVLNSKSIAPLMFSYSAYSVPEEPDLQYRVRLEQAFLNSKVLCGVEC